jgi:hypothetical protein
MKRTIYALCAAGTLAFATPAIAADTLVSNGITYTLTLDSITNGGLTGNFTLGISGINTASDTEGGRTGINAFAFNDGSTVTGGTSTGFTFMLGGLNSTGCDGSGAGFFCFTNAGYILPSGSSTSLDFSVTNTTDAWASWSPDFKIDWTGSKNNYDLVSLAIPLNTAVPEPATWAMMLLGFAGIGMTIRKRRTGQVLAQVA